MGTAGPRRQVRDPRLPTLRRMITGIHAVLYARQPKHASPLMPA
jgi:hypothetical protein